MLRKTAMIALTGLCFGLTAAPAFADSFHGYNNGTAGTYTLNPRLCPDLIEDRIDSRVTTSRRDLREDRRDQAVTSCPITAYTFTPDRPVIFTPAPRRYSGQSRIRRHQEPVYQDRRGRSYAIRKGQRVYY